MNSSLQKINEAFLEKFHVLSSKDEIVSFMLYYFNEYLENIAKKEKLTFQDSFDIVCKNLQILVDNKLNSYPSLMIPEADLKKINLWLESFNEFEIKIKTELKKILLKF